MPKRSLVVKITCGPENLEKLNQAWMVAALAVSSGVDVHVFLAGDATYTAVPGRADDLGLAHATPLADLRDAVLEGGSVSVCSQCATRRDIVQADLVEGAQIRGATVFVDLVMSEGAQALVY